MMLSRAIPAHDFSSRTPYVKILLAGSWVLFFSLFFFYIFPIGLISDDLVILKRAERGLPLWTIHYSPALEFLWGFVASNRIGLGGFKLLALSIHLTNCGLFYLFIKRYFGMDRFSALLTATLFLFSAAGLEAIAWNCCLGYLITSFFLFLSLNLTERFLMNFNSFLSIPLAFLQFFALMAWDWGVLIVPMSLGAIWFFEKRPSLCKVVLFIAPASALLLMYLYFRSTLNLETVYGKNSPSNMVKFFLGSPLLIMLPNVAKPFFSSTSGALLSLSLFLSLIYFSWTKKKIQPALFFFALTLLPWIIGGYPSSRYYYLAAPFLFAFIPLIEKKIPSKNGFIIGILALQAFFFFERARLWNSAYVESKSLSNAIEKAYRREPPEKQFVVVNVPDAFGPENFPLRPQSWHNGLETISENIIQVKIPKTPFVWAEGSVFMERNKIKETFANAALFEVVLENKGKYGAFALKPFE